MNEFDTQEHLADLSDDELKRKTLEAKDDLEKAAREQPDSDWHCACFAGLLTYAMEMNARGLKLAHLH